MKLDTQSFATVAAQYEVIFFDAFGVLKNSQGLLPRVLDVLAWLRAERKEVFVVTNDASKSPTEMARAYVHPTQGELVPPSRIVSSGLLAKDFLRAKVRSGEVAYLGKPASAFYIESAGLTPIPICRYATDPGLSPPKALALMDDEGFDWSRDINAAVNLLRNHPMPVVVANTDLVYPIGHQQVGVAIGALATMVERIVSQNFIRFGKPDTLMFSYGFSNAVSNRPGLRKSQVLMVGDTLYTDVLGANAFGIDTALVLSGNTVPNEAGLQIRSTGIIPTAVCESILT